MSDISHFRTSVSHPRSDVSCSAARPDKTRQIDFETKQAVAVMFSEGDRIRVEVPHCLKAVGMIQKQMKQNLDAKLSRTRAGEIQRGYCSYSGTVGGGMVQLMCLIVQAVWQRFVNS